MADDLSGRQIPYTNLYDLLSAAFEHDPEAYLDASAIRYGIYFAADVQLVSSVLPKCSEAYGELYKIIVNAQSMEILPHAVTGFQISQLHPTDVGLAGQIHWIVDGDQGYPQWDEEHIFIGQGDLWGKPFTVTGIDDFESIRDHLNKWAEVEFSLEMTEDGWITENVSLQEAEEYVTDVDKEIPDIDATRKQQILDNLPAIEDALRERMKNQAQRFIREVAGSLTEHFHFVWKSTYPISAALLSDELYYQFLSDTRFSLDVHEHLGAGTCENLFDVVFDEPLLFP